MSEGEHGVITHRSSEELLKRRKDKESKEEFLPPSSCWLVTLSWGALEEGISFG